MRKKKQGVTQLIKEIETLLDSPKSLNIQYLEGSKYIHEVMQILAPSVHAKSNSVHCAIKVLELDEMWLQKLNLTPQQQLKITAIRNIIEKKNQTDIESYIIQMRY